MEALGRHPKARNDNRKAFAKVEELIKAGEHDDHEHDDHKHETKTDKKK